MYKLTGVDGTIYVSLYAFAINDYSGIGAESQKLKGVEVGRVLLRVDILREGAMKERMVVVKADKISSTINKTGRIAIYGISLLMHTVRTMQGVLEKLAQGDVSFIGKGVGFEEYKSIVGFDDWAKIEDRFR